MLENTRKWLENELTKISKELKEKQEVVEIAKRYKEIFSAIAEIDNNIMFRIKSGVWIIIPSLIVLGLVLGSCELDLISSLVSSALIGGYDIFVAKILVVNNIRKYKQMTQIIKDNNIDNYFDINELKDKSQAINLGLSLLKVEEEVSNYQEYLKIISDILQSDDLIERLTYYQKQDKFYFIKEALEEELNAYLEEISHISPSDVHLTNFNFQPNEEIVIKPNGQKQLGRKKSPNL